MTQSTDITLSNQSGAGYRAEHNSINQAFGSTHKGSTAPSYAISGMLWIDDSATPWVLKAYDGTDWISIVQINATTNLINIINHGSGSARSAVSNIGQIQDSSFHWLGTSANTNTLTASLTPAITAYAAGQQFAFKVGTTNTGAVTININGVGAKAIQINGQALIGGELKQDNIAFVVYDGTQFQLTSPAQKTSVGSVRFPDQGELTISSGAITISGTSHTVDTESDAASDDLATINGGVDGQLLILRAENTARTVVIKAGTGNIETPDGNDITLDTTEKVVTLQYDLALSDWLVVSSPASSGSAGMNLLGTYTASSDTSVDIGSGLDLDAVIDGTYDAYEIIFTSVLPVSDASLFYLRTGNGGAFDSGASDYNYVHTRLISGSATANVNGSSNSPEILISGNVGNGSAEGISGKIIIYSASESAIETSFDYSCTGSDSETRYVNGSGRRKESAAHDRIRFLFSSGNIASGNFYFYGIRKT